MNFNKRLESAVGWYKDKDEGPADRRAFCRRQVALHVEGLKEDASMSSAGVLAMIRKEASKK